MCAFQAHIGIGASVPAGVPKLGQRTTNPAANANRRTNKKLA
jgi:hypothetical protein